ncbi:MAG: AroM family protein [Candidatus Accumulibacter sp.]|jgi:protein AroM|nr:AroM family protein [Accumulibacter sp.]
MQDITPGAGPVIGVLALGLSPRPDLEEAMLAAVPGARLLVKGGLDGLGPAELEPLGREAPNYPLMVRLRDQSSREADMFELLPHLVRQGEALAREGAERIVLMCSGGFPEFSLPVPVIRPVALLLAFAGLVAPRRRVGLINPIAGQQAPAAAYWKERGYTVASAFASPFDPPAVVAAAETLHAKDVDLIALDCMSFTDETLAEVKRRVPTPVLLPMRLVQAFFRAMY